MNVLYLDKRCIDTQKGNMYPQIVTAEIITHIFGITLTGFSIVEYARARILRLPQETVTITFWVMCATITSVLWILFDFIEHPSGMFDHVMDNVFVYGIAAAASVLYYYARHIKKALPLWAFLIFALSLAVSVLLTLLSQYSDTNNSIAWIISIIQVVVVLTYFSIVLRIFTRIRNNYFSSTKKHPLPYSLSVTLFVVLLMVIGLTLYFEREEVIPPHHHIFEEEISNSF